MELGCGKGEYTTELAKLNPNKNYIGFAPGAGDTRNVGNWIILLKLLNIFQKQTEFLFC